MKIQPQIIKELVPFLITTIIALLILPIAGVQVGNNTSRWLTEASNILHATGPASGIQGDLTVRRPLFPLIIAGSFKVWGKSVHSAVLITRIFFALELILIYLLGRIFYNIAVGLLSFGLVSTSFGINSIAKTVDTDIVHPFFILVFLLIYYLALRRESWILAILSGVSLGLALLIKETALFCLGLPIGIVIFAPKGKRWSCGKIFLWSITALIFPLILWALYMFLHKSSLRGILDSAYAASTYRIAGGGGPLLKWKFLFTTGLAKSLTGYNNNFLQKVTPLSLLLPLGWIFIFIRGVVSKKLSDLTLGIITVCALPLILQLGYEGDRPGQTTVVYVILYITLAALVFSIISWFVRRVADLTSKKNKAEMTAPQTPKSPPYITYALTAIIGILMLGAQLFSKNLSTWKLWTRGGDALALFLKKPFEIYGRFTIFQEEAAKWLKKNAPPNAKIIADGYTNEALDFFDIADYKIPVFHPVREILISQSPSVVPEKTPPLFLFTYSSFDSGIERTRGLFAIYEADILSALRREKANYLVFSGRSLYLKTYFEKAPWVQLTFDNERVLIFEIHPDRITPVPFKQIGVNETINDHIAWLEKNHPDEYRFFIMKIEALGLTLDEIKNSPLRIPKGQTY